ncbi:hypothetical protein V8E36_008252, partial [Tilletia maclaganii]
MQGPVTNRGAKTQQKTRPTEERDSGRLGDSLRREERQHHSRHDVRSSSYEQLDIRPGAKLSTRGGHRLIAVEPGEPVECVGELVLQAAFVVVGCVPFIGVPTDESTRLQHAVLESLGPAHALVHGLAKVRVSPLVSFSRSVAEFDLVRILRPAIHHLCSTDGIVRVRSDDEIAPAVLLLLLSGRLCRSRGRFLLVSAGLLEPGGVESFHEGGGIKWG